METYTRERRVPGGGGPAARVDGLEGRWCPQYPLHICGALTRGRGVRTTAPKQEKAGAASPNMSSATQVGAAKPAESPRPRFWVATATEIRSGSLLRVLSDRSCGKCAASCRHSNEKDSGIQTDRLNDPPLGDAPHSEEKTSSGIFTNQRWIVI